MKGFRQDINALRALAVTAVVLFHFFPDVLTGGFAGVDVFFVISGYLMTSIIYTGLKDNRLNIFNFYLARANRIIPALSVLCFVMLALGYFYLVPWDYKTVGRDVATSIAFVSNVMFSMREAYFTSEGNFFLHTWSLSAEWQFYIIYPIVLLGLFKLFGQDTLKRALLSLTIIFFALSVYLSNYFPTQSYFLLPSRAWEMLLGGVVFLFPLKLNKSNSFIIALGGYLLILLSYIWVDSEDLWPSFMTLIPTLGTCFVIWGGLQNSKALTNGLVQRIGLWSYSIYLWHWPVVTGLAYFGFKNLAFLGILSSIVLGFLSYRFIEQPFSRKLKNNRLKAVGVHLLVIIALGAAGSLVFITQGLAQRLKIESSPIVQGGTGENYRINEGVVYLNTADKGDYDYLLLGDSNANHYTRGILKEKTKVKQAWLGACMSFPSSMYKRDGLRLDWKEKCREHYKLALNESKPVILVHHWDKNNNRLECTNGSCPLTGNYLKDLEWNMHELLKEYKGLEVYLLGDLPRPQSKDLVTCMKSNYLLGINQECQTNWPYPPNVKRVNEVLIKLAEQYESVQYIPVDSVFCTDEVCKYDLDGKSLFMPDLHLSSLGSEIAWKHIAEVLSSSGK